jgi:hypothetical protein
MKAKTTFIILLVIIVITIVSMAAYFKQSIKEGSKIEEGIQEKERVTTLPEKPTLPVAQPLETEEPAPSKTPIATELIDTSAWKVYRNEKYGFEMRYPEDFIIQTDIPVIFIEDSIISFKLVNDKYYKGTNLAEASLAVGVREGREALASCFKVEPFSGYEYKGEELINGITFHKYLKWEGATGHLYEVTSYRTIHRDICFEGGLFIHSRSIGAFEPGAVSEFNKKEVLAKLNQVFSTFKFLK